MLCSPIPRPERLIDGTRMTDSFTPSRHRIFRAALLAIVLSDIALVLLGLALYPKVLRQGGLLGAGAAISMVALYGFLALYSPLRFGNVDNRLWKPGVKLGTVGGLVLGLDLLSNYFIYRDGPTNSKISLVIYGFYLLLLLGAAARGGYITRKIKEGLIVTLWYVFIAQLIWFFIEFGAYYLFSRTPIGVKFIQTEMQEDFRRSGEQDFQTFVIGDFFGAGFFHLLLIGLVAALIFGSIGALTGKIVAVLSKGSRSSN